MPHDDTDRLRVELMERVLRPPPSQLAEAVRLLARLAEPPPAPTAVVIAPSPAEPADWPHAPLHRLSPRGTYIVTAATYLKQHHFRGAERLDCLQRLLLSLAKARGWQLEAWAVFSNHYHFVAHAPDGPNDLPALLQKLHADTALYVNDLDGATGRQVWHNYWDTELTFESSYFARLNYVHQNPVKHGLVTAARLYPWCSAGWSERAATPAQVRTISRFKIDKVRIDDDYQPV